MLSRSKLFLLLEDSTLVLGVQKQLKASVCVVDNKLMFNLL